MEKSVFTATILLAVFLHTVAALAGVFIDEFDKPKLNEQFWVVKTAGKGDYEIKDGKLILSSPSVESGITFYYAEEIKKEDMIMETKLAVSGISNDGTVGFMDDFIKPQINTDMHPHMHAMYVILTTSWGVNADFRGGRLFDGNYAGDEHIFTIELKGNDIIFSVDGKVGGKAPREADSRFYVITPDFYTSHYTGTMVVDYIKLSGGKIPAAIQPSGKIAAVWGSIKNCLN